MLVGLVGQAQHGKDSIGARLVEGWGFKRLAFADALKRMALVLNPYIHDPEVGPSEARLARLVRDCTWEGAKQNKEVRRFLQVLGTEAVRDILGEGSWVNALAAEHYRLREHEGARDFVITDVRFPNEVDYVVRNGGTLLKVERPGFDNGLPDDHVSEALARTFDEWDYLIENDDSLGHLDTEVDKVVLDIRAESGARA